MFFNQLDASITSMTSISRIVYQITSERILQNSEPFKRKEEKSKRRITVIYD